MTLSHLQGIKLSPWYFHRSYLESYCSLITGIDEFQLFRYELSSLLRENPAKKFFTYEETLAVFKCIDPSLELTNLPPEDQERLRRNLSDLETSWHKSTQSCSSLKELINLWANYYHLRNPLHIFVREEKGNQKQVALVPSAWSEFPEIFLKLDWLFFLEQLKRTEAITIPKWDDLDLELTLDKKISKKPLFGSREGKLQAQELHQMKKEQLSLVNKESKNETTTDVMEVIQESDLAVSLSIEDAARSLGLSKRTLQRKLEKEGTQFNDIKRMVRRYKAHQLLTTELSSISSISQRLGFSEPAAFNKFFKDWTGLSPLNYRQKNLV